MKFLKVGVAGGASGLGQPPGVAGIGAVSYTTSMGKGLREPCSPYREAYIFGVPFGLVPDANNWNCPPEIVEPTTLFDLSAITPNHEVVVALLTLYDLLAGASHTVHYQWYRNRDGALIAEWSYNIPDPGLYGYSGWEWYYIYCHIGYVDTAIYGDIEINENGIYHVDIWLDQSLLRRYIFTVTGIPVELAGEISHIWMWHEPLETWGIVWSKPGTPPPELEEIPLGGEIYISPVVVNRSEVAIVLHMDLEVTYPDGSKHILSAASLWEGVPSNQDEEWPPGGGAPIYFEPFTASQEGTYTVVATLSSGGQVLDTVTFELPTTPAVPEYKGTITRMELEYDETWGAIPVSNIPQNDRGILHIWGRNDTAITQRMGIYWFVADPDGLVVQEYSNWELWPYTSPGGEHGFLAGRFDLDKVGKYTTWIELLMNPDDPQVVDRYIGDLCTVAAVVPEPEFAGFSITEYTKV